MAVTGLNAKSFVMRPKTGGGYASFFGGQGGGAEAGNDSAAAAGSVGGGAPSYTPLKLLSFEGGTLGATAGGATGFVTPESRSTFSDAITPVAGTRICRTGFAAASNQAFGGSMYTSNISVTDGTELWVRTFEYFPAGWAWTDNNAAGDGWGAGAGYRKWIRIWFASGADNCFQTSSIGKLYGMSTEGFASGAFDLTYNQALLPALPNDQWVAREYYVKFHSDPAQGKIRGWQNGTYLGEVTGKTKDTGAQTINHIQFGNYWNGGATQSQYMYLDEIIITAQTPDALDAGGRPFIGLARRTGDFA